MSSNVLVVCCLTAWMAGVAYGISYGEVADYVPWQVGVFMKTSYGTIQTCSGSLVREDIVITSVLCFWDSYDDKLNDISIYTIAAGKRYRDLNVTEATAQERTVERVLIRENVSSNSNFFINDIAIAVLTKGIAVSDVICPVALQLDQEISLEGQVGQMSGWGFTEDGRFGKQLRTTRLPYVNSTKCLKSMPESYASFLTDDKFCAGIINGSSSCMGDQGAGLVFDDPVTGVPHLGGFVSVGLSSSWNNSCWSQYYTLYTSIAAHRDWIKKVMKVEEMSAQNL